MFSVVNVVGKVEQDESDKDIRQTKHKVVNMRILIVPLFFDTQLELDDLNVVLQSDKVLYIHVVYHFGF